MKALLCMLAILLTLPGKPPMCKTTFTITDCDGMPVPGVTVSVEKCTDHKLVSIPTNIQGKVVFQLCKSEICKTKVTFGGYKPIQASGVGKNCKGDTTNLGCSIKICDEH
jgi:hypothetical protein